MGAIPFAQNQGHDPRDTVTWFVVCVNIPRRSNLSGALMPLQPPAH